MTSATLPQTPHGIPEVTPRAMSAEEYLLKRNTHGSVLVPFLENLASAVGMSLSVIAAFILLSTIGVTVSWLACAKISLALGLLVLGLTNMIRFASDEIEAFRATRNTRALDKDRQNLVNEIRTATARIQQLESELSISSRYTSLAFAEQLLREFFFENKPLNRDTAMARGWTRANWTLAYKHLQNADVVDGRGQFKEEAINYEAAMGKALMVTHGAGRYVRAKDGSMMRVGSHSTDTSEINSEEELGTPTLEVGSRSNREVKGPRQTQAYTNYQNQGTATTYKVIDQSNVPGYSEQVIEFNPPSNGAPNTPKNGRATYRG